VWEKMQEAMEAAGRQNSKLKRRIANWARNVGLRSNMRAMRGFVFSNNDSAQLMSGISRLH